MQMRPNIQITSVIKAMTDVVLPAIDPANKLAIEQSQLILGILNLLASQLPVQFRFDRDELSRLCQYAHKLGAISVSDTHAGGALAALGASSAAAASVLEQCQLDPAELTSSVRHMREAMGELVCALATTSDLDNQLRVERIFIEMSKEQLLRDRSLMKMQGWEVDPEALSDIELLLGPA
jgi:hypothetical protein